MSLTVSESGGKSFPILPEGSYVAICNMLVDLGLQYNETYKNSTKKVRIGFELPEERIEVNGESVPRNIGTTYTASLNEKSILRRDLASWRGRDFTAAELEEFNLRNIVGAPCLIQVIHKERNGNKYVNIASIMSLPKGMAKPQLSEPPIVYDIDEDDPAMVNSFQPWLKEMIVKSESYQARINPAAGEDTQGFTELEDDELSLPF